MTEFERLELTLVARQAVPRNQALAKNLGIVRKAPLASNNEYVLNVQLPRYYEPEEGGGDG